MSADVRKRVPTKQTYDRAKGQKEGNIDVKMRDNKYSCICV
jgi:hypothetical protein